MLKHNIAKVVIANYRNPAIEAVMKLAPSIKKEQTSKDMSILGIAYRDVMSNPLSD